MSDKDIEEKIENIKNIINDATLNGESFVKEEIDISSILTMLNNDRKE